MNPSQTKPILEQHLDYLKLRAFQEHYQPLARKAAEQSSTHQHYLEQLVEAEVIRRQEQATARRIGAARFPVIKTLDDYQWNWPKKINRLQIQTLMNLSFLEQHANVIIMGGVGLGKTHLAIALGHQACQQGHNVLFSTAVDVINALSAASAAQRLKSELKKYITPEILILDEMGYLPIDKVGGDLLFQVISQRYERGSTILTTNQAYKNWPRLFNNDSTLVSALLDRLLHHAENVVIEGMSYRMKDRVEES